MNTRSHGNVLGPNEIRSESVALCQALEEFATKLDRDPGTFGPTDQVFRCDIQPRAVALVRTMIQGVPGNDPRIAVMFEANGYGQAESEDLWVVSQSLYKGDQSMAAFQLRLVKNTLEALSRYLPN